MLNLRSIRYTQGLKHEVRCAIIIVSSLSVLGRLAGSRYEAERCRYTCPYFNDITVQGKPELEQFADIPKSENPRFSSEEDFYDQKKKESIWKAAVSLQMLHYPSSCPSCCSLSRGKNMHFYLVQLLEECAGIEHTVRPCM